MIATRITVPDLICNAHFLAIVLDLFNRERLNVVHELILSNYKACHRAVCALPAQALSARGVV